MRAPRPSKQVSSATEGCLGFHPGMMIADRYRLEHRIGSGGMGEVWVGEHVGVGIRVALKKLLPECPERAETTARLLREAHLLGRVRSDHVARVIDYLEVDRLGPVLVTEFVDGDALNSMMSDETLSIEQALDIAVDVLQGLTELHRAHIVHRDLKPANVILHPVEGGIRRAILIDFGISRLVEGEVGDTATDLTRADMTLGTIRYMAPEQITGASGVTPAADLYALGAILFRLVTGRHVYGDLEAIELARTKLIYDAPSCVTGRTDPTARGFEQIVDRALRRCPEERFETASEMLEELELLRATLPDPAARDASRSNSRSSRRPSRPPSGIFRGALRSILSAFRRGPADSLVFGEKRVRLGGSAAALVAVLAAGVSIGSVVAQRVSAASHGLAVASQCNPGSTVAEPRSTSGGAVLVAPNPLNATAERVYDADSDDMRPATAIEATNDAVGDSASAAGSRAGPHDGRAADRARLDGSTAAKQGEGRRPEEPAPPSRIEPAAAPRSLPNKDSAWLGLDRAGHL